ncbi:hypothetical protein HGRIS_008770 [Hohenbuehelia grisea]|uniref:Metallo-beta-lactamase domain-containing protein n=1 Tax=Hohenbuehelia grisea TaxID=104357 RepID=A0ABR3J9J6_9AGAR
MSPLKPHHAPSSFKNPWPSGFSYRASVATIANGPITRSKPFRINVEPVKTIECDFRVYESESAKKGVCATWLGHAGFLVQLPNRQRIVFDPIFAERASPSAWIGPRRWLETPCQASELPEVQFIAISHSHYDHLDLQALRDIIRRSPDAQILVPLGLKTLITEELSVSQESVKELDWWDNVIYSEGTESALEFVCTPAQHNSGRGLLDQNETLWCSWVARQIPSKSRSPPIPSLSSDPTDVLPVASIYHAGDTGYTTASGPCPAFAEIGRRYGPFDLAMIPIWRGASLSILGRMGFRLAPEASHTLLSTLHASPGDAVRLSRDVRARHTLGMHFGTFCGSEDESQEPLVELVEALLAERPSVRPSTGAEAKDEEHPGRASPVDLRASWQETGGFGVTDVGETVIVPIAGLK